MYPKIEKRIAAQMAKSIAMICVRNTFLESLHRKPTPETKTGDWSDVKVIDANGEEYKWTEVSHINDHQMKKFIKQVVNRLYTYYLKAEELDFNTSLKRMMDHAIMNFDEPELDALFLKMIEDAGKYDLPELDEG